MGVVGVTVPFGLCSQRLEGIASQSEEWGDKRCVNVIERLELIEVDLSSG